MKNEDDQKLQYFYSFLIRILQKWWSFIDPENLELLLFLDPEIKKWTNKFLDPETVELIPSLGPEIIEIGNKSFMFCHSLSKIG